MTWGIWQIFTRRLGSVKIGTLMCSFCLKQKAKKFRKIMCKETEEWWKVWRGSDLLFQNWHKEFEKFWLDHTKFSIVCTLMGCFWSKYVMFQLNKYRGIQRIMYIEDTEEWWKIWRLIDLSTLKNDEKFDDWLTCRFRIDIINLTNFWVKYSKISKICTLMGCFWSKYIMFELKKKQRSYLLWY